MDFGQANRLNANRDNLARRLSDYDFGRDVERAESLRGTLVYALGSLRDLYEDWDLWACARQVNPPTSEALDELLERFDLYNTTLPALLELFGYREPPPPSARQAVGELVAGVREAADNESPAEEIAEAHDALGRLLERAIQIHDAEPWEVAELASQAIPALEMGVSVATGAAVGAVTAVIGTAVVFGALTGGVGALAPILILGGVRRWKRKRAIRERTGEVARNRELLHYGQFPAAQGAVDWHLREIADLQELGLAGDPLAITKLNSHTDALISITGRFVTANGGFRARIQQSNESGNSYPLGLVKLLERVNAAAISAKGTLYQYGGIDSVLIEQMEQLRQSLEDLIPPEFRG
jgi:hypothetical protein